MQMPPGTCAVIDSWGEVQLHRGNDKNPVLSISKADDYLPAIEAGDYCYFVHPDTAAFERIGTNIKQPRTDAPCTYQKLIQFTHIYGGGTTSLFRDITIWSDGEVSGDFKGSITPAQLTKVRRLIADPAFVDALLNHVEQQTITAEPSSISIATPEAAAGFFVELVDEHDSPTEMVMTTKDGIPRPVRETLNKLRTVLGKMGEDMDVHEVETRREVFSLSR